MVVCTDPPPAEVAALGSARIVRHRRFPPVCLPSRRGFAGSQARSTRPHLEARRNERRAAPVAVAVSPPRQVGVAQGQRETAGAAVLERSRITAVIATPDPRWPL